ncbi:hypothetical protein [Paenibacillus silviterrae]|uniref:hypothetical protein n=1 Tax=Paenibacillus silviterrae TaxID=3242194 RepID=UPI002543E040|nr:hypothetical protein [Paenibacillus chinjuensis]
MRTELSINDRKIPVSFISSDQKAIPQLLNLLNKNRMKNTNMTSSPTLDIERIEIIGNQAVLHSHHSEKVIELPLY